MNIPQEIIDTYSLTKGTIKHIYCLNGQISQWIARKSAKANDRT